MSTPSYTKVNGEVSHYDYSSPDRTDGRRNGSKKRGWQVAEMWEKHHEIARFILLGMNNVDVAERIGCTPQQVSNVRNSPVVQDKLSIMKAARDSDCIDLSKEIMALAPVALKRVKEAITTGKVMDKEVSASQILKESNGILDREMGKAIQRVDSRHLHATLTPDDIERIKKRATILAGENGQLG